MSKDASGYFLSRPLTSGIWIDFNDSDWLLFASEFRANGFGARETVKSPAQFGNLVFFVAEGLVRFYYLNGDGTESDRVFAETGMFVHPVTAIALDLPYGCQALTKSVVLTAGYEPLSKKFKENTAFRKFDEGLSRTMLSMKDRHVWALQNLSASDRVLDFATRFPHLVDRVPQYHIASYLGMSPISYSRLKKEIFRRS